MSKMEEELGKRSERTYNRYISTIGLFIMCLMLSLPVYSAQTLAATVTITQNHGSDNFDGFLNGDGDVWTLEATLSNVEGEGDLDPSQVVLDLDSEEVAFTSCSGNLLSSTCSFESSLPTGIPEGVYPFSVRLYNPTGSLELGSDTSSVISDASGPTYDFRTVEQNGDDVLLSFTVFEEPATCVGLEEVEIIDADAGDVLQRIEISEDELCEFEYSSDGGSNGILSAQLSGEGLRHFRIKATDKFGHSTTSSSKALDTDFSAPQIELGSLELLSFGDFIGGTTQRTDVVVSINECNELVAVAGSSEQINFVSDPSFTLVDSCVWEAHWTGLEISPTGNVIAAEIVAEDENGNIGSAVISATFIQDVVAPRIEFIGTQRQFEGRSYAASGDESIIIAKINEGGSGIDPENGIALNLFTLDGSSDFETPDVCIETAQNDLECRWNVRATGSSTTKQVTLRLFEDRVGNEGDLQTFDVIVDSVNPIVQAIEFEAVSTQGRKDFFSSNDDVIVRVEVEEEAGLDVFVDARDMVMDAESKFQYGFEIDGVYEESEFDGWMRFNEQGCSRDGETHLWKCEFNVPSIKSGYDSNVPVEILVKDTAGNRADCNNVLNDADNVEGNSCKYEMEIFALDEETQPDFWEIKSPDAKESFVDLDISELTHTRASYTLKPRSDIHASLVGADALTCTSESSGAPTVSRLVVFGGQGGVTVSSLSLLMEFAPFSPSSVLEDKNEAAKVIDYTCTINPYSIVDNTALQHAEQQEIIIPVQFAFSKLGALDENIDELIYQEVSGQGFRAVKSINEIAKVLRWGELIVTGLNALIFLWESISTIVSATDGGRATGVGNTAATASCFGAEGAKEAGKGVFREVIGVLQIFYCKPVDVEFSGLTSFAGGWQQWQRTVLELWKGIRGEYLTNMFFGKVDGSGSEFNKGEGQGDKNVKNQYSIPISNDPDFDKQGAESAYNLATSRNAASLYDNIYVGAIGLCVPSVVFNLQKLYQSHCAKLACLQNDVPAGLATVETCSQIHNYLNCKYFLGEVVAQIMTSLLLEDIIVDLLKSILFDPVGTAMALIALICTPICSTSGTGVKLCSAISWLFDAIGVAGNVINAVQGAPSPKNDICEANGIETDFKQYEQYKADHPDEVTTTDDVSDTYPRGGEDLGGEESAEE